MVKLGEICEKAAKIKRKEVNPDEKLIYLDIGGIDNRSNRIISHKKYQWKDAPSRAQQIVKVGDTLFSTVRTYLKNIAMVDNSEFENQICSSGFTVIRSINEITDSKYLFALSLSEGFLGPLNKLQTGTSYPAVRDRDVFDQTIPLPPLLEQRAIVSKIEQLFSDLDNGIENFKKAQEQLKIYRQAVLKKAIEGEFTKKWREEQTDMSSAEELLKQVKDEREKHYEKQLDEWKSTVKDWEDDGKEGKKPTKPKKPIKSESLSNEELETLNQIPNGWTVSRFIDLIKYEKNAIKRGPFGSAIKKSFFVSSGYKVYEQQNAIKNNGLLGNYYINEKKFKELNGFSVKGGDYIVSCSGTIGRIHKLQMNCENGVINQALLKIALDEHLMLSQYFLYLFRSEVFQRKILKGTRGTGMQNLASVNEIKLIPINIPPKTEQSQIVQEIETRLSICDNMETTMTESLQKAESLRQSILKRAFEGKLLNEKELEEVRNAFDWEPAEKLLERIRAEKTNVSKGRLI